MERRTEVPIWYRVLDRFGFPTLFGVVLLGVVVWQIRADREDRIADRTAFVSAMAKQGEILSEQTRALVDLRDEVRARGRK